MTARIRVGIVGAGYWGPNLVRTFQAIEGCELAWVCDSSPGRRQYLHEHFPGVRLESDFERALYEGSATAVAIATPVPTHLRLGEAALRAGVHVLMEKPLAGSVDDAATLVALAQKRGLVLATGHVFVYHPAVAALRELILGGEIGRPCYAQTQRMNLGPPTSELDVVWDLAVHDVSILLSLVPGLPSEVVAEGRRYVHPSLNDVAFLTLRYESGFIAVLHVSWRSSIKVRRFFIAGTDGSAFFDDMDTDQLIVADAGRDTRIGSTPTDRRALAYGPGEIRRPVLDPASPLTVECTHFLDCITTGRRPIADGMAGLDVIRVLEAAQRSMTLSSTPVQLLPANLMTEHRKWSHPL